MIENLVSWVEVFVVLGILSSIAIVLLGFGRKCPNCGSRFTFSWRIDTGHDYSHPETGAWHWRKERKCFSCKQVHVVKSGVE